jgi:hypothetical protein
LRSEISTSDHPGIATALASIGFIREEVRM